MKIGGVFVVYHFSWRQAQQRGFFWWEGRGAGVVGKVVM